MKKIIASWISALVLSLGAAASAAELRTITEVAAHAEKAHAEKANLDGSFKLADLLLTGVGASGSVAPYAPQAVAFNPEVALRVTSALTTAGGDSPYLTISFWMRGAYTNATTPGGNPTVWLTYFAIPAGNLCSASNAENCAGEIVVSDNASGFATLRLNTNQTGNVGSNPDFGLVGSGILINDSDTWHHYLYVENANFAAGSKRGAVYRDGVKLTTSIIDGTLGAFNLAISSNVQGWGLNSKAVTGVPGAFEIADFYMNNHTVTTAACPSGIIDSSNNVCSAWVSSFYSAGPVALGTNCSTPSGDSADVCFVRNGAVSTFATNQGSATATFGTGAYVDPVTCVPGTGTCPAPVLFNAASAPITTPTTPYESWVASENPAIPTGVCTGNAAPCQIATQNEGHVIAQGDLLILAVDLVATATTADLTMAVSGWTSINGSGASGTACSTGGNVLPCFSNGTLPSNYGIYYKYAAAGDITNSGAVWGSPPTFTWSQGATLRGINWALYDYKNVNATPATGIQAVASALNVAATTTVSPAVSVTGPATVLTINQMSSSSASMAVATGADLRYRRTWSAASANPTNDLSDRTAATGTVGPLSSVLSQSDQSMATNIVLHN